VVQTRVTQERAQQNLARQRQLTARNAGTAQDLQNSENDAEGAKAAFENAIVTARATLASALSSKVALDVAQQTLNDMTVRAPVPSSLPKGLETVGDGPVRYAVVRRPVHEGQMVKEGEALFDLVIQNPLRLWANVPERFTPEIQVGQTVRVQVGSRPNETFPGRVARINPSVDPVNRTFQVEALVPNAKGLLRPGGFAKATILTKSDSEAAVVPMESVVKYAGVTKIFVVENKLARAIPVETRLEGKDWLEVIGNLPSRAKVVTSGQAMLADGTPVEIREKPKAGVVAAPEKTTEH
jgi:RND family efflux transporter MFP subunit